MAEKSTFHDLSVSTKGGKQGKIGGWSIIAVKTPQIAPGQCGGPTDMKKYHLEEFHNN